MYIGTPIPNQSKLRRSEIRALYTLRSCSEKNVYAQTDQQRSAA